MKTLATIAIISVGIMLLIIIGFMTFMFGGLSDIFPSKKQKTAEN